MKHRIFLLSVVSAALIIFGCGQEGLVSPQLTQSDHGAVLAKATVTSFTATIDLTAPPVSPGQITVTNGVTHIRGQINQGPITGDIVGTATAVFDVDIVQATGKGSVRGPVTLQVTQLFSQAVNVTYQVNAAGQINAPVQSGNFQGQGTDGSKINGSFTDQAVNNIFVLTGRLVGP